MRQLTTRILAQAFLAGPLLSEDATMPSSSAKKAFLSSLVLSSQPRFSKLATTAVSWAVTTSEPPSSCLLTEGCVKRGSLICTAIFGNSRAALPPIHDIQGLSFACPIF